MPFWNVLIGAREEFRSHQYCIDQNFFSHRFDWIRFSLLHQLEKKQWSKSKTILHRRAVHNTKKSMHWDCGRFYDKQHADPFVDGTNSWMCSSLHQRCISKELLYLLIALMISKMLLPKELLRLKGRELSEALTSNYDHQVDLALGLFKSN